MLAERMPHGDPALHGSHRGEHEHTSAVARRVHTPRRGSRHPIDLNEATLIELDARLLQTDARCVG